MKNLNSLQRKIAFWVSMSLFTLLFLGSAVWTLVDIPGTIKETEALGYPHFTVIPLAIAKILGLVAILSNRFETLKIFAFAGFLYDLILATLGHIYHPTVGLGIGVAILGIVLWILAFTADRYWREEKMIPSV